jgi:hypothetical protein
MKKQIESIQFRPMAKESDGELQCSCGRHPRYKGFCPCDLEGNEISESEGSKGWVPDWYVCDNCGQMFDVYRELLISVEMKGRKSR